MAALRVGVGLAFYFAGYVDLTQPSPIPVWAFATLGASFAVVGGGLLVGNKSDPRAAWLGGVLLLLAVPMTQRLVAEQFAPTYPAISRLRPDAFLPAFLCWFVATFPSSLRRPLVTVATTIAALLITFGTAAMAAHLSTLIWPPPADFNDWRMPFFPLQGQRGGVLGRYLHRLPRRDCSAPGSVGVEPRSRAFSFPHLHRQPGPGAVATLRRGADRNRIAGVQGVVASTCGGTLDRLAAVRADGVCPVRDRLRSPLRPHRRHAYRLAHGRPVRPCESHRVRLDHRAIRGARCVPVPAPD